MAGGSVADGGDARKGGSVAAVAAGDGLDVNGVVGEVVMEADMISVA